MSKDDMNETPPKKKRAKGTSLKQRSVLMLRRQGFDVADVERRIPRSFVTVDLFNFADLVAIRADVPGVLAIQSTSTSNQAARVKKILAEPRALTWLRAGNRIEVHGWLKSKRTRRWECTVTEIKASDFDEGSPEQAEKVCDALPKVELSDQEIDSIIDQVTSGELAVCNVAPFEYDAPGFEAEAIEEDVLQLNRNEGEDDAVTDELRRKAPEDGQNNGKGE